MGAIWLVDLADIVNDAGIACRTWKGWETRSRKSGGYEQLWAVFVHHTASNASPDNDCRYMWENATDRPIGALYLARDGTVTVGAAGATNTQGKGGPCKTSKGTIPADQGNTYGLAVEAANAGTGEAWPTVQQDTYLTLCAALCAAYGLNVATDICSHWEWTPGRKIDPAGNSRYATGGASWDMNRFRADVAACSSTKPPEPDEGDTVTDDDIDRIAQAIWTYKLKDEVGGSMAPAGDHLRLARRDAHQAAVGTKEIDKQVD